MLRFLNFFLGLAATITYNISNFTININTVSTGTITNYTAGDKCKKIIVRNSHVYHTS